MARILVVDDDAAIVHLIAEALRLEGYVACEAANGRAALAADAVVAKPFALDHLLGVVADLVGPSRGRGPRAAG